MQLSAGVRRTERKSAEVNGENDESGRLPGWMQALFWTVVSLEWLAALSVLAAILMPVWHAPTRNGVLEMLCLVPETTVYASGFSAEAWQAISMGDARGDVLSAVGPPLEKWTVPNGEWWSYSDQRTPTDSYLERKVRFDSRGHVAEKHEECYVD